MDKQWLNQYDEGVPYSLEPYPERTLLDSVEEAARQRPDHPALLFKGTSLSCGELERQSTAFAAALAAQGVKKGDRVALMLPNCPQFVIGQLGAWKAGAIAVPLNPLYTGHELVQLLTVCGAETVLVLTPFYAKVKEAQPHTSVRCVIATNIKEYLPAHLRLLFTALKEKKEGHRVTLQAGDLWLGDLLRKYARAPRPDVSINAHDPAMFLFTGGTTGTPKAAVGAHQSLVMSAMQMRAWRSGALEDWEDVCVGNLPLFHCFGNIAIMGYALLCHCPLALVPNPRDLDDLLATIQKVRPGLLPVVPALLIGILNHAKVKSGKIDLTSIKLCFSSSAPLLTETKKRFEAATGCFIFEGYSLTEAMIAGVGTPVHGKEKPGSVGVPLPDVELRILDAEDGHTPLAAGQVGEVVLRAPQLMQGYWQRPAETNEMLRDGWLFTGDLGYVDEDNYLFIVDRKKDLIKPGGFQVWPREVEEVIAAHPAVMEVGVAGVPDAVGGEMVKAWVVLRAGQQASEAEIRAYCREKLVAYKVPKQVEFRDSLPRTPMAKLSRRELVREEKARQAAQQQVGGMISPGMEAVLSASSSPST